MNTVGNVKMDENELLEMVTEIERKVKDGEM